MTPLREAGVAEVGSRGVSHSIVGGIVLLIAGARRS